LVLLSLLLSPTFLYVSFDSEEREVFNFIKKDIPKGSILLTPPYDGYFRIGTEKAIVVDFKALPFSELDMVEWYSRIKDVTNNQQIDLDEPRYTTFKKGYNSLKEEDIISLKEKYNFSYVVFENPKRLNFTTVFENDKYIVYSLNGS